LLLKIIICLSGTIALVPEPELKGTGRVVKTILGGAARCFDGDERVKLSPGKVSLRNPLASFMDFAGVHATMTARGTSARHPGKGTRSVRPLTTEKMLSAKREMSNIFLQRGQNIDIAHKKAIYGLLTLEAGMD